VTERVSSGRGGPAADTGSEGEVAGTRGADPLEEARRRALEEPGSPQARLELGRLYRGQEEYALALEQLEVARHISPEDVEVLMELAGTLTAVGRPAEAEKEFRRAQRLAPDQPRIHRELGILLFKRGLYRQAEVELMRAIELDDTSGDAYFYRGEALNQLGRFDDALQMLERAVQYQPNNAKAYYVMGILYDRKYLRQEATTMYRKAREVGAA
jgi:Flp pilus assembly protein TadD